MDNQVMDFQEFRTRIKTIREDYPHHWEASRKLMTSESLRTTLPILLQFLQQAELMPDLRTRLIDVVQQCVQHVKTRDLHQSLKELTGLPPSKALRALLVWGVLALDDQEKEVQADGASEDIERCLKTGQNPYDLLLQTTSPSVLDIGAGDLTFEQELVDVYVPRLRGRQTGLLLHAFDRLMPGSRVGGVYHKNEDQERYLQSFPAEDLRYQFWGGMGLEQFNKVKGAQRRYTVCTCHAPANPTFAYEPTRIDRKLIHEHLKTTRGQSRLSRYEGEPVLEVSHQGQELTFPPWKFDIVGSVELLQFMMQRSRVGVLSAIDDEVFWELLSQILAEDRFRPRNRIFTKDIIPEIFGEVHKELSGLPIGERADLSKIAELRDGMPWAKITSSKFRYVEIRRGAYWEGIPSSFTAKQFAHMKEESPPWWIIFLLDV